MKTYYLKTNDRQELIDALTVAGMWEDGFKQATMGDALDEIGTVQKPTGNTLTVDGMEVPEMTPVPGYHANLLLHGELPEVLSLLTIPTPANPVRVWA